MAKITVAVLFGGRSSEHEVSCMSVVNVVSGMKEEKYDVIFIGITKEGKWLKVDSIEEIQSGKWLESDTTAILSPDRSQKSVLFIKGNQVESKKVDVVFPVLHGLNGEDGTVQGIFELADIPYVGCGVLSSSVTMDKISTKLFVDRLNIRQAKYVAMVHEGEAEIPEVIARVENELGYPVFVKPSNAGSSQGVSKASDAKELKDAILLARKHDKRVLIEEAIDGREIECAVKGGENVEATVPGEVLAAADFYDYDAKYNNAESKTVVNPELPDGVAEEIRRDAEKIFKAVNAYSLSRVDFFVEKGTNEVIFNEINTLPGFTSISMYPMLWSAMGVDKYQLIDSIIETAFERKK